MIAGDINENGVTSSPRRDTRLPRYSRSAYKIFFEEKRAEIINQRLKAYDESIMGENTFPSSLHSTISFPQLTIEINQIWRDMSTQDRNKFKARAIIDSKRKRVGEKHLDHNLNKNSNNNKDTTQMGELASADATTSSFSVDLYPHDWANIDALLDDDLINTLSDDITKLNSKRYRTTDYMQTNTENPDLLSQSSQKLESMVESNLTCKGQVLGSISHQQTMINPHLTNYMTTTSIPSVTCLHPNHLHSSQPWANTHKPLPILVTTPIQKSPMEFARMMGNNTISQLVGVSSTAPPVISPMSNILPSSNGRDSKVFGTSIGLAITH